MKDYKLILAMLILLILLIFIGAFLWLWGNNQKNIDPLPITFNERSNKVVNDENKADDSVVEVLHLQAENGLKTPLDDVISRFEKRHPNIKVSAHYVPSNVLMRLPDVDDIAHQRPSYSVNPDIIMANDSLSKAHLSPLQTLLNDSQNQKNAGTRADDSIVLDEFKIEKVSNDNDNTQPVAKNDNQEARQLVPFSYALKDNSTVDGVILTDNSAAISFRNFLLSSMGQDILKQYDYDNIEGYKNSLDDLFNPSSQTKAQDEQQTSKGDVEIADALSNGK
ncbi:hypothetical protein J3492_10730 [Psychrobacter sp. F1192]|uniref:Uncharacterized protein n=1 Tax=Psychrobacter coccoides TaxID=2818440 RepID=A0ABS3NQI6_9GAMM|nr:hypothetical protein [Psychrobacter coccoides]MBO1531681.1 hypothetical protein [Psychrobacter coccoides]